MEFSLNKTLHILKTQIIIYFIINFYNLKYLFYLFINYNTITKYILIIYELSNFDHLLGVVSQTRVSDGNRTHDPHTNSLAHYPLDYQGTQFKIKIKTILLFQYVGSVYFNYKFEKYSQTLTN